MKHDGGGFKNVLRFFRVLIVIFFGFVAITGCSGDGGGDGDSEGGTPDTATFDATGTWNVTATFDLDNLDTNFQCIPGESPGDDTREITLILTQTGNSFSMLDGDGHTYSGTINGATYTFSGSWTEPDDDGDYTVTVSGSFTLNASSSFTGIDTVSATNSGGNYCEWEETSAGTKQSSSTSLTITGESGNQVNLNGTWSSLCIADADDGESEMYDLTISGAAFSRVMNLWLDSMACSGPSDITVSMSGTVSLGDELMVAMNSSSVSATAIDITMNAYEGTINNAALVSDFNARQECGFDDWMANTPKDLLGTACQPDSDTKDVMYIDDTADPDVGYFGDDGPFDANGYPIAIDLDSAAERM
jgi:hypothetical protein